MFTEDDDFGGAVGILTNWRYVFNLNKSSNNIDELNLKFWYNLYKDERKAYFYFKIFNSCSNLMIKVGCNINRIIFS